MVQLVPLVSTVISNLLTAAACAVIGGDEEVTTTVARFFLKEYQFTTDAYRMFEAVSKMCHSPANFYCDSAIQKFMLRQVKAMDYALVAPEHRDLIGERGSYLAKDKDGRVIVNKDMDVALLMLYGHILSTSHSYAQSLSKSLPYLDALRVSNMKTRLLLPSSYLKSHKSSNPINYSDHVYS